MEQVFQVGDDYSRQDTQEHYNNDEFDKISASLPVFHVILMTF